MVLLSGRSGSGKTTILNAILYALYGTLKKPFHLERKRCSVTLEMSVPGHAPPLTVKRVSPGNQVTAKFAGTTYEDDAAQGLIDTLLMDAEKFQLSSYVVQRLDSSVLSLSPRAQLAFVKKLSETDEKGVTIANLAKRHSRIIQEHLYILKGKAAVLTESRVTLPECSWTKGLPSMCSTRAKISSLDVNIPQLRSVCETLEKEYQKSVAVEQAQAEVQAVQKKLGAVPADEKVNAAEGQLETLESLWKFKVELQSISALEATLRKNQSKDPPFQKGKILSVEEKGVLRKKIAERQQVHAQEVLAAETVRAAKEEIKKIAQNVQDTWAPRLKQGPATLQTFLRKQLGKLGADKQAQINALRNFQQPAQGPFPCPACKTEVILKSGRLVAVTSKVSKTKINKVENNERILREAVSGAENALRDVEQIWEKFVGAYEASRPRVWNLSKINSHASKLEKLRQTLAEAEILEKSSGSSLAGCLEAVHERRNVAHQLLSLKARALEDSGELQSLEMIEEKVRETQAVVQAFKERRTVRENLSEELRKRSTARQRLSGENEATNPVEKKTQWKNAQADLQECHEHLRTAQTALLEATEKEAHLEKVQKQAKCQTALDELNVDEISSRNRLLGFLELGALCTKAELLSSQATLRALNDQAQIYLDSLFDEQIVVRLERSRVTLKGTVRDEMSVSLVYHGIQYDDLNQLSGGERQRCNLAFLLAVNDMVGSPILLLDECLNNLDDETHETILKFLKTICVGNKLIIAVAHEANESIFDRIIQC